MAEVLTADSTIGNVVAAALHSARLLLDDLKKIRSADEKIKAAIEDLSLVVQALSSLDRVAEGSNDGSDASADEINNDNVRAAAYSCNKICTEFRAKLSRWIKNPTDKTMDWRDKFRVGFLAEKEILDFRAQLVPCKGTFTISLRIASIVSSLKQAQRVETMVQELREAEDRINQTGGSTLARINDLNAQMERAALAEIHTPSDASSEASSETPSAIQSELITVFENSWKDARSEIVARQIKIGKVVQGAEARALVGIHGFDEERIEVGVDIDDVNQGDKSKAAVGWTKGLDVNAFFK